jgi:hypothetical protein
MPLVAPPPPFDPLAEPKKTGSPFFRVSSALHAASINDAARAKTTEDKTIVLVEDFPILNAGDTAFRITWQITLKTGSNGLGKPSVFQKFPRFSGESLTRPRFDTFPFSSPFTRFPII